MVGGAVGYPNRTDCFLVLRNCYNTMKELIIAFDIDGTIYGNKGEPVLNLKTVQIMALLREHVKNCKIYAWSGGGKEYAEQIVNKFGLDRYVDKCFAKFDYDDTIDGMVDIAFDDEYAFNLADKNLIVKLK